VFVFRKPLFINILYHVYFLHEYRIVYSIHYYPQFQVTAVGLGTYYPWIQGHYCILLGWWKVCRRRQFFFFVPCIKHVFAAAAAAVITAAISHMYV
jgi:hypothetical protein